MKILYYLCFPLFTLFTADISNSSNCFEYPQKIVELNSTDIYDSARWVLYNWLGAKKLDGVYYGQMELKYNNVVVSNDTMLIIFNFYATDFSSKDLSKQSLVANASVTIQKTTKKCIWAFNYPFEDFSSHLETGDKMLESAPTAETINFLENRTKVNNCFLELAKRRSVVK